ncbi:hypothetical protein HZH68_006271 [Vespula germanica]|uniref:Uncharacterized protein n=1 Tax=Vespula germanica TaxID=30212 RepID=A0A834KB56_VESGE|nr:hypothetical protein HZH68_006271 [Vespula germanica]
MMIDNHTVKSIEVVLFQMDSWNQERDYRVHMAAAVAAIVTVATATATAIAATAAVAPRSTAATAVEIVIEYCFDTATSCFGIRLIV